MDFLTAFNARTEGINHLSPGPCLGCAACTSVRTEGMSDEEWYDAANVAHFSWRACEGCGSTFGGDRFPAHGFENGHLAHLDICVDCLFYLANGDEPSGWYGTPQGYASSHEREPITWD